MADLLTDTDFDLFRKVIYDESGITFSATNRSVLDSRLKERLRDKQLTDIKVYYNLILSDKEEMKVLLDSVTTNLTRFFRTQKTNRRYNCSYLVSRLFYRGRTIYNRNDSSRYSTCSIYLRNYRIRYFPKITNGWETRIL